MGVKKRLPTLCDIKLGQGKANLQQADTVRMVDVDLSALEDDAQDDWFPDNSVQMDQYCQPTRNYIQFCYDHRLCKMRMTIKAMAVNTGNCDAEPVTNFLYINEIQWGNTDNNVNIGMYPELRNGRGRLLLLMKCQLFPGKTRGRTILTGGVNNTRIKTLPMYEF